MPSHSQQRTQNLPPTEPQEWSRCMAEHFMNHYDPTRALVQWRHNIPDFVLRSFCTTERLKSPAWYNDEYPEEIPDTLVLYDPKTARFDKRHWSQCFGDANIYEHYFDNLKQHQYMRDGFKTFETLQRIDRDIFAGLTEQTEAIWRIHEQAPRGEIRLRRGDLYYLRKLLFLMTSVRNRDRNQHLMARDPAMQDARNRRKKFMEAHSLDHPRDLWLQNAELILNLQHYDVATNMEIFDLDREDYRANARERFVVFWEAGPGEEFILTDNAFGCFEGGQLGARKNSTVNLTSREHEQRIYTRDYMWHQLYVLSPKLVLALCHWTLIHPELAKQQRKRWGLRRSMLEGLPHEIDLVNHYFKDLTKGEVSFLSNEGWTIPPEVEKLFGAARWDGKVIALENRENDDLVFPITKLSPEQVSQVNVVLLQNQHAIQPVQSVSFRPSSSYRSLHDALVLFREMEWSKYTDVKQNHYDSLEKRLTAYFGRADEVLSNGTLRPSPTILSPQSGSPAPDNRKPVVERKKTNPPVTIPNAEVTKIEVVTVGQGRKERRYSVAAQSNAIDQPHKRERSNPPPTVNIPPPTSIQHMNPPPISEQRRATSNERTQPPRRAHSKDQSAEPQSRRTAMSQGQPPIIQHQHITPLPQQRSQPQTLPSQSAQPQRRAASNDRRCSVHIVEQLARSEASQPMPDSRRAANVEPSARGEFKPTPEPRQHQAPTMESQPSRQSTASQEQRRAERSVSASRRHSVASHHDHLLARVELQPSPIPHPQQALQPPQEQQPVSQPTTKRPVVSERRYTEEQVSASRVENSQPVVDTKRLGLADKQYYSSPGTILQPSMPQAASIPVPEPRMKRTTEANGQTRQTSPAAPVSAPAPVPVQVSVEKNPVPAPKPKQSTPPVPKSAQTVPALMATQALANAQTKPTLQVSSVNGDSTPKPEPAKPTVEQRVTLEQKQDPQRRLREERVAEQRALEQQVSMNGYNRSRDRSTSIYLVDLRDEGYDKHDLASEISAKSSSTGSSNSSGSSGSRSGPESNGLGLEARALECIAERERDISPPKRPVQPVVYLSAKSQPSTQKYSTASTPHHLSVHHPRVHSVQFEAGYNGVSDAEVEGSLIVEVDEDDQEAWEDEGNIEVEEVRKPRKPIVRFASPKPSPTMRKAPIMALNHRGPRQGPSGPHGHSQFRRGEY